jgi:hypothetical protein
MPREVFTYTYSEDAYTYLPLAPVSSSLKSQLSEVHDERPYQLYNKKKKPVGYIWETGNQLKNVDKNKDTYFGSYNATIYFDEKTDSEISYIMFNFFYKYTFIGGARVDDSKFLVKANATSKGGKYLNKNVVVTYKEIGETEYEIILEY